MTPPDPAASDQAAVNGVLISARQAIDLICDRWTLLIVLALLHGERRFNGLAERTGMAGRLLAARLKGLQAVGLITRTPYSQRPPRFEYALTTMGSELWPVALHMHRWDQAWAGRRGRGAPLTHASCASPLETEVLCRACGRPAGARDIELRLDRAQLQKAPQKQSRHRRSIMSRLEAEASPGLLGLSLDIFGDKWGIEVLLCAFLRIRRFNEFRARIGIAGNILSDRLERLVAAGVLAKDREARNPSGYWLTPRGVDAYPITVAIHEWADQWVRGRYKSPVTLIHGPCGQAFWPDLSCLHCHRVVHRSEVAVTRRSEASEA